MILDDIVAAARRRLLKKTVSFTDIRRMAEAEKRDHSFPFEQALKKDGISFICEVKKASPSKGIIAEDFPYLKIAKDYEAAGADAVSVLTEPEFFLGRDEYLYDISREISLPVLRKDFIIDLYQIYEAKVLGASAVLLISGILEKRELEEFTAAVHELGMSALVEAHDAEQIEKAASAGARVIGVNNRDLRDFSVDIHTAARLKPLVPEGTLFVSESGIKTADDIDALRADGVDGVLIGETLMRSADKTAALKKLRGY